MFIILTGVLIAAALGLAAKVLFDRLEHELRITWTEFAIGIALCAVVLVPSIAVVGTKMALANNLSFDEYWNGYEVAATRSERTCTRDGSCRHTYDCDPYIHTETRYRTVSDGVDSKGNPKTRQEAYTHTETRYHSCPYVTHENTFVVSTTLGNHTIASAWLPENPDLHRWRPGKSVPSRLASGIPPFWAAAKARIDAGDPGPVTAVKPYDNYILAAQRSLLKRYSAAIEDYRNAGLIVDNAQGITDKPYLADKAYVLGVKGADSEAWIAATNRFGAALGVDLQGDLHFVAVDHDAVDNPDDYVNALMAYWQSPDRGDKALSKNALVLVVGTDGHRVRWARVETGMPSGNEKLIQSARSALDGVKFTPDALLGKPVGKVITEADGGFDAEIRNGDGAFEKLVWGPNGFKRECMMCDDADDSGLGFKYLGGQIRPTGGQKAWILALSTFASAAVWAVLLFLEMRNLRAAGTDPFARRTVPDDVWTGPRPSRKRTYR